MKMTEEETRLIKTTQQNQNHYDLIETRFVFCCVVFVLLSLPSLRRFPFVVQKHVSEVHRVNLIPVIDGPVVSRHWVWGPSR